MHTLTSPLPSRNWERIEGKTVTYTGRVWREEAVLSALLGGGWFKESSGHVWASQEVAEFAHAATKVLIILGVRNV